jgi:hypothetical protein
VGFDSANEPMSLAPYGEAVLCPFKRLDRALPIPLDLPAITATFPVRSNKSVMTNLQFKGTSRFEMGGDAKLHTTELPRQASIIVEYSGGKIARTSPRTVEF